MLSLGLHPGSFYLTLPSAEGAMLHLVIYILIGIIGGICIVWPVCVAALYFMFNIRDRDRRFRSMTSWAFCGGAFGAVAMLGFSYVLGLGTDFIFSIAITGTLLGAICGAICWLFSGSKNVNSSVYADSE